MDATKVIEIYCTIDDLIKKLPTSMIKRERKRKRKFIMSDSEVITIMVLFHMSHITDFEYFYAHKISHGHRMDFPNLLSYSRFVERILERAPLCLAVLELLMKECTGISYIDSTPLKSCHIKREYQHRVMASLAHKGRTSMGWFYGMKLHLAINHWGELISFAITPGNVNDREPLKDGTLLKGLHGRIFADSGYISNELSGSLAQRDIELIAKPTQQQKHVYISQENRELLSHRSIIETVIGQLKTKYSLEHTRHRSIKGFYVNLATSLMAYQFSDKKPGFDYVPMAA